MIECITAVSEGLCVIYHNVGPSDKMIRLECSAVLVMQHQERTFQHKSPPKSIETEKLRC